MDGESDASRQVQDEADQKKKGWDDVEKVNQESVAYPGFHFEGINLTKF